MAVSIPLSPESFPPSCATIRLFHTLSLSLSLLLLPSTLPSATLSFPFCVHLIILLPLPPPLSLSPSRFCIRVPIAVESLSGLAERRFRRHDNEPRKPSHSLTPFLLSSLSLPLSTSPRLHRFPPPTPMYHHHNQRPSSYVSTRLCICMFLRVYPLRIVRTPTTLPPECKNDVGVASAVRARSTLQTAARFIHLLHILLPGCCTPAQPSLAEGGRCTQPCATPGRMCVLEERDLRCLPAPRPDGNIERIAPRLIGVERKKERKERKREGKKEEEHVSNASRIESRSKFVGDEVENEDAVTRRSWIVAGC